MTTQETAKTRRHFEPAFKLQVAKMIREQGISLAQVCKDMDLVPSAVRRWVQQLDDEVAGRPGLGKPLTPEQQRIRQLERENQRLKEDVALLKKASAFFAQAMK